jgi:hypothetical protein
MTAILRPSATSGEPSGDGVESLPMASPTDSTRVEGLITRQAVTRRYQEELDRQTR